MSSNEDDREQQHQELKKRRVQRACDVCRKRKTRCDGGQMPNNKCTNCTVSNSDCTYTEAAPKRGPTQGYVDGLEKRVERLDKLLKRVCPDTAVYNQLSASLDSSDVEEEPTDLPLPPPPLQKSQVFLETVTAVLRNRLAPKQKLLYNVVDEDDETSLVLSDSIKKLNLDGGQDYRFFGKSSEPMLIQRAMRIKTEYTGGLQSIPMQNHRPEFWRARPWEKNVPEPPPDTRYVYPDKDLSVQLIDHYFEHVNLYLPLIHRPSFEKNIAEGLHLTNASFAHVYFLVCAIGSRWSDDRRVLPDGEDSWLASGWTWFHQVEVAKNGFLSAPTLYDIQYYCLCVQYLQGCSVPQATWTVVGFGIRLAQDVGAHRRKMKQYTFTAEDEMLKRAFWVLVCLDRMISAALGRPCAIQDEDFDLDLPINCDDEYWDHPDPDKRFKQPPNKPSKLTAFILYLKLNQILAFSLRFIYSINKAKLLLGYIGQHGEQHIVAELDSALNQWVDSLPDHLRWDPNRENEQFFRQSVVLYSTYYHIQILIHRPFIPSPSRSSPFEFPSLAICTNAARSASHIIDVLRKRNFYPPPHVHMAAFTAAIALLLNIWGGKRSGIYTNPEKEMADVYKCMDVLKQAEKRWHSAGRLWSVLVIAHSLRIPLSPSRPRADLFPGYVSVNTGT